MTVSDAYLLGIREGRAAMNAAMADGIGGLEFCRAALETMTRCMRQGFGDVMQSTFRGERDFYRNQLKIGAKQ